MFGGGHSAKAPAPARASRAELLLALNSNDPTTRRWARAALSAADESEQLGGAVTAKTAAGARPALGRSSGARRGLDPDFRRHLEKVAATDPDPQRRLRAERVLEGRTA